MRKIISCRACFVQLGEKKATYRTRGQIILIQYNYLLSFQKKIYNCHSKVELSKCFWTDSIWIICPSNTYNLFAHLYGSKLLFFDKFV